MLKPMREMMVKMEEAVWSSTLGELMRDLVWPAVVSTAAVALIPKEANHMPASVTSDQSRSRAFCATFGQHTLR